MTGAAARRLLAKLAGEDPPGRVWVRDLGGGRYQAGCTGCGCGDVFPDAKVTAQFVAGHFGGDRLIREVSGS